MAEEAGIEPTEDARHLPPDLKSGHPTRDVSLPLPGIPADAFHVNKVDHGIKMLGLCLSRMHHNYHIDFILLFNEFHANIFAIPKAP